MTEYLERSGLLEPLEKLGFSIVGYGCTTCIGNSGPLPEEVANGIKSGDLIVSSVLSGNRNFEGRIHSAVKMNFSGISATSGCLLFGRVDDVDLYNDPLATSSEGKDVFLKDLWPSTSEINSVDCKFRYR